MTLIARIKDILVSPETEWRTIDRESGDVAQLLVGYVAYLAAIPAIAGFIGMSVIGFSVPTVGTFRVPFLSGLLAAIFHYALTFVMIYGIALIANSLALVFAGQKNFASALKLTVYSFTPFWLACVFLMIPGLRFLIMLGLYGVYLLYRGIPTLMKSPPDRALGYAAAIAGCAIVVELIVRAIRAAMFALPGIV